MSGRKLWYMLTLLAFVMLPLAGCSGSSSTTAVSKDGYKLTVSGNVEGGKSLLKTLFATAPDLGTITVINAQDGAPLGNGTIDSTGKFSNLAITLTDAKSVLVFKADVSLAGTPFRTIVPIDLSNPPAAGISASNSINISISQKSTDTAKAVSAFLGLTGLLGDTGATLTAVSKTYADAATQVASNGGQVLAYNTSGLALNGEVASASLLPAKPASELTYDDLLNVKLGGSVASAFIPGKKPIVNFTVTNSRTGKGISGLTTFSVHFAQLKADGSTWLNYKLEAAGAARDREFLPGTISGNTLIDKGDGSYTMIINQDVDTSNAYELSQRDDATKNGTKLTFNAGLVHRIAITAFSALPAKPINPATGAVDSAFKPNNGVALVYDFIPSTGAAYVNPNGGGFARDLVTMAACDSCHGPLVNHGHHFGSRPDTKVCVICHTVQNKRTDQPSAEFTNMIHTYHMGKDLPDKTAAKATIAGVDASEIGYPQDARNCAKCHTGKDSVNRVGMKPTEFACKSCHNDGSKTHAISDKACSVCHDGFGTAHTRTGSSLTFEITEATVDSSNKAVVKFKMNLDGITKLNDFSTQVKTSLPGYNGGANVNAYGVDTLVTGYGPETRTTSRGVSTYPTIRVDYAKAQDGITNPDDFNANVSARLDQLWDGSAGTLTYDSVSGVYTATITAAPAFPASGTKMATAKIVGYGTFTKSGDAKGGIQFQNVSKAITDTDFIARRTIVSNDKCNSCHEKLASSPNFHSGMRNDAPTCAGCHTPNLENSGWSVNASTFVHAIHGRDKRSIDYRWEDINWSELTYPGVLRNCEQCHAPINEGTASSPNWKQSYDFSATANRAAVEQGRLLYSTAASATVGAANINRPQKTGPSYQTGVRTINTVGSDIYVDPIAVYGGEGGLLDTNKTNLVHSPISAACFSCHDTAAAKSHMEDNGGSIYAVRATALNKSESCLVCHGPRGADTTLPVTGAVPTIKTVHRWW